MEDIMRMEVNNEDLPKIRKAVRDIPNKMIRRFIIDGHNGKEYWHNELNGVTNPSCREMNVRSN
jgi:hypothetical protein